MGKGWLIPRVLAAVVLLASSGAATAGEAIRVRCDEGVLHGTLEVPAGPPSFPVALIIPGSGPTDRDGNNPLAGQNNCLRYLAEGLSSVGIASVRFDKRGIGESRDAAPEEEDLRFETYIKDALLWCDRIRRIPGRTRLMVIGHSEGSLVGMVAGRPAGFDGFVSIAGAARSAPQVILEQLRGRIPDGLYRQAEAIIGTLKKGCTVDRVPGELQVLFRPSVQPYLISWFAYEPVEELARLKAPALIVHGSTDMQVPVENATRLAGARESAELAIIDGMNHVLKAVPADPGLQRNSYADPALPVMPELINRIALFAQTRIRPFPRVNPQGGR